MKKILAIFLLAGVTFALFPQAAGTEPKDSQPIVVGTDGAQQTPPDKDIVKTTTTKKGYTSTTSVPETITTVVSPDKVLEREARLTWLALGLRSAIDYHLTPSDGSLSAFWFYGEIYNTLWGVQAGLGYLNMPVTTYTDQLGTTYNGTGTRNYLSIDLLGKIYMPFAKWWWAGAGVNYAALMSGQLKWYNNAAVAAVANPTDAQTPATQARWQDINSGGGIFYGQVGTGLKIALGNGFNQLNLEPEFRALIPLNAPTGYGIVLRVNIGVSYAFGL